VKILIDAQLPPGLKLTLIATGHEVLHVVDVGLRDAGDTQVWDYAVSEGTAILTKDEDFAALRPRELDSPTIVWLRIGNCSRHGGRKKPFDHSGNSTSSSGACCCAP
jgi:predicted nuclease of predicted toxin-antitoxin system